MKARKAAIAAGFTLAGSFILLAGNHLVQYEAIRMLNPPDRNADGLVVITGSHKRVATGFEWRRPGQKMLISGVSPDEQTDLKKLCRRAGYFQKVNYKNLELSCGAMDTYGNALEIRDWLKRNPDIKSVLIVTGDYQLPRARLEIGRALTKAGLDVNISYLPVAREHNFKVYGEFIKLPLRMAGSSFGMKAPLRKPDVQIATQAP